MEISLERIESVANHWENEEYDEGFWVIAKTSTVAI